jgi:glycosyltransferase involved in cell wall biosynthesis
MACDAVASTGRHGSDRHLTTRPTEDGLGTVYEAAAHGLCDLLPAVDAKTEPGFLTRGLNHFALVHSRRWQHLFTEVLDRSRPDIVHTNTLVGLTPAIWAAARDRNIPIVHTLRDYHLLCPRTTLLRSDLTDCQDPPLPCRILAHLKVRQTRELQLVTAPTRYVIDRHLQVGAFPATPTAVVPNALEEWPEQIPPREDRSRVRGLFLGQINNHKGVGLLLEVLDRLFADSDLDHLSFDFAGTGPWNDKVHALVSRHPDRASFHGMIHDEPKRDLLRQADFMVVPSLWSEPFSRSIIDGFSWGLPAIGSRRGGIPEVITDQEDGLLIEPNAAQLEGAMRLLATDHPRRRTMSATARRHAENFTLTGQVDRFTELYQKLLAKENPGDPEE